MAKKKNNTAFSASDLQPLLDQIINQPNYIEGVQYYNKTRQALRTPENERTQLQKYLLEDLERINQEEELQKAIKQEQEVKNGYEQRKALLEAEDKASSWLGDMGNFFSRISDGYSSIKDMNSYYITKDGKILKKKKFTGILNPTGGIDNKNNTYDESVWEEVKPEDYLKARNEIAEKRATSDVYDAGYKISDTLDKIVKGIAYDTPTGIMRLIGNIGEGELGKAQANLMLNDVDKWMNNLMLSFYEYGDEKFGEGETWLDRIMWGDSENKELKKLKQRNDELSLNDQNLRNKIKSEFDSRAKSGRERTYYNDLIEDTLGFQDSDDFFTQQQQLRSSVTNLAAQIEGREKPEFLSEEAAGNLDQRMIKLPSLNGGPAQYMPYENLSPDSESLWDAKQMILDENGVPVLDESGMPAYRDKFTLGDKLKKGNYSDMFTDKYGSEQLIDAGASSASFLLGGAGIGKATGALGKGIGRVGQAASKELGSLGKLAANNSKFIDGAAKMLNDSRIGKLATSDKVIGTANKVIDKFAYNAKAVANSYLMTNTESQMIGEQTFDNSYNDYIDKAANINSLEIQKELQASGISSSDIDLYLDIELRKRRNEFEQENPEVVKDAIGVASAAKELAVGINNLNTLMNINYGAFFAKTKSFSSSIKKNPFSARNIVKGGLVIGREGAQEYLEEGVMNQYAQYAGESLAKGKVMSLNDYIENHLSDKESVTSGVIGLFSGAGMSMATGGINTNSALKAYKKQQKEIQNLKKISDYSKEDLQKFLNGSIDAVELMSNLADIRKLQDEGRLAESAVAADKMLLGKSVRAALTGTSGVLNDTLTSLAQQENLSQEERDNIQSAIDLNNVVADANDRHINLAARNKIIENRGLKFLINREKESALMSSLPDANTRYEEELDRFSRQALNSENESAYLQDNYNDILEEYKRRTQLPADNSANLYLQKTKGLINSLQKTEDTLDQQYEELKSDKYQADYLNTISKIVADNKIKEVNKDNAEQVKEELRQEEILTPETEAKIDQKVKEQTVKENVGVDPVASEPVVKAKIQENTETPTQNEDDILNNILSQQDQFLGMEDDFDSGEWFSPRQRNTKPATANPAIQAWKNELDTRLGREATFQDFVERVIKTKGYDYAEEIYKGLRDAVGAIGVDVSKAQEIYNAYFNTEETSLNFVESLLTPKTEQEVARENKEVQKVTQQVTAKKEDYDSNNTPQYVDFDESEDRRTATAAPKAAFNRLDVKRINDTTWEVLSRGLTQDSIIDNNFILDSDYIKSGLQLTAQVRDIDEIPMTEYLPSGDFIATTWGQYKAKHKLQPGTKEYSDKVPIVVMDGGTPVFMLHEVSWYNTRNISDRFGETVQEDIIDRGRKNISRIREQVVSGNNLLQITDTHFGSIDNLEQHVDKTPSTIQDAAGESSTIGIIKVDGDNISIHTTRASKFAGLPMGLDAVDSNGNPMYKDGDTVDIRWAYNNKEGKPVYMVFKTMNNSPIAPQGNLKNNLPESVVNNSKFAILANIVLSNQNHPELRQALEDRYKITLDKAKKIRDQIKEDTNIDIESNLADYIAMYVQVGYAGMNLEQIGNSELRNGLTYFDTKYRNAEGKIKSTPNRLQVMHKTGNTYEGQIEVGGKLTQGRTVQGTISNIEKLFNEESGIFNKAQLSTNLSYLGKKDRIIRDIDSNGNFVQDSRKDYNTFLKNNLRTNVLSHEITTPSGKSKWIIDVQPMIYFDLASEVSSIEELPAEVRQEVIKENLKEAIEQILPAQEAKTLEEVTQELTPEQQKELEEFLRRYEDESSNNFNSRWTLTSEQNAKLDVLGNNNITGLTVEQNEELVSSLKNSVISSIDFTQHVTVGMLRESLETSVEKHIQPKLDNKLAIIQAISKVPNMADKVASLQEEADLLQNIINEKEKLISISRDNLGSLTKEFNRIFNVNFEEEQVEDSEEVLDEAYSKSFLEKEIKLSYSVGLRLSLFGIPILNESGNVITNFTGLPRFHSADDVDLKLKDITASIPSNWNVLISRLQDRFKNRNERIYKQLEEKLTKLPVHLQNELLYKMVSKKLDIFKIINSPEVKMIEGEPIVTSYNIRVYDENSTKEDLRLRNSIINDFETSDFAMYDDSKGIILNVKHTEIISKALDKYVKDNLGKNTIDAKKLKEIFNKVGLQTISENTIEEYLNKGNNPFQKKKGILWFINEKLKQLLEDSKEKKLYLTDKDNNLFNNSRKALNKLVNLEVMLNGSFVAKSIRVNDKIMQGIIANTSLYDIIDDLKTLNDSKLYRTLIANPLTKNNTLLELLQTDERFRESFSVGFSSPDAYKLHGRNNYGKTDFDKLAKQDNLATVLGLYTNTFGYTSLLDPEYKKGLRFRIGQMPVLTLSDKGRMAYLTTALLELRGNDVTFNTDGTFNIDAAVSKHIAQQVFESELDRIISTYENEHANIINYSKGAKMFLSLPVLNSLTFKGVKIHEYLINSATRDKLKTGEIREQFINEATVVIQDYLNNKVNEKISPDGSEGQFIDYGIFNNAPKKTTSETSLHNIDTDYVNSKPGEDTLQKLRYTTAEFEINSLLNYNNIHQLFLGDLAFYSKDKTINNLIGETIDPTQIAKPEIYSQIAKEVGSIVHKRAASLIAPGFKLANSQNPEYGSQEFLHVAINDVEGMSDILKNLIEQQYGELSPEANQVFNQIIEINKQLEIEKDPIEIKRLKEKKDILISNNLSEVQDYFNINGTDAQEYTTWKAHADMLYRQGNLTQQEKDLLDSAYEKLSKGEEISSEELQTMMQPVKPVYTGLVPYEGLVRPVYIKSSAFPLLPQVTKNLKIDEVRKKLEALESENKMVVRMSYQSANKIGALNSQLTMDDLYNEDLNNIRTKLSTATSVLPLSNFKIQQETPSKEDKAYQKGKDSYITMGSQFFKIILGNGINKMTEDVFPNIFPSEVLDMAGVTNKDMLSGEELDKIYFNVYSQYSKLLMDNLYSELGITSSEDFYDLPTETQNDVIQNLNKILRNEIIERGQPDYLEDSIRLIEEEGLLQTNMPIIFDANRYKFEALMQSIISNRLIIHKLPGNAHISASSEGFVKKEISTLEELSEEDRTGIVWLDNREPNKSLQATTNKDKQIISSEVILKSHWKVRDEEGNFKYIDLSSDEYSEPIYEDDKLVGRKLLLDKIDPQLLENFSFRIPTSSHQSGVILKVVGFLPQAAEDLILVPKEHTVQLGEDYDIDKRYIYKSNYYVDSKTGNIKKLVYTDVKEQLDALESMFSEGDFNFDRLVEAVTGSNLEEELFEALEELRDMGLRSESVDSIGRIGRRTLNNLKIKMLENAIIDMYKSVYKSPSTKVQQKVFKPLVTDIAGNTANYMEQYVSQDIDDTYFSTLSDSYQRDLLKLGADGKAGIGVHSNAVTLEAQMQRLDETGKIRIQLGVDKNSNPIWFEESIGDLHSDGHLGNRAKTLDGYRDIADQHGENQNVSTDNINKQIMGKRNENTYTMSVYAFMAHLGYDLSKDTVDTGISDNKGSTIKDKVHIPSVFINQPIIRDYVRLKEKYASITSEFVSPKDIDNLILNELGLIYDFNPGDPTIPITQRMDRKAYEAASMEMTGQTLWNNLKDNTWDSNIQQAVIQKFFRFQEQSGALSEIQQLINLSTSKLGVSYFEVLQRVATLNNIVGSNLNNATKLIGEHYASYMTREHRENYLQELENIHFEESQKGDEIDMERIDSLEAEIEEARNLLDVSRTQADLKKQGYKLVGEYWWKPTTIEGVQLINSLKSAQDVMPINFPYNNRSIDRVISSIFYNKDVDPNKKSVSSLKWKYEIMSALNDFVSTDVGLFNGDATQERKRLFFNSSSNKALARILKDLREQNNPIMKNSLLRDLDFNIGLPGNVSTIAHLTDYNSSFDRLSKYEAFKQLVADDSTSLGEFNGEILTPRKLAQDLATYSYLSNTQNGATGFRNYIAVPYLEAIGVTNNYRDTYKSILSGSFDNQLDNFIRQYFQHNPQRAAILSKYNQESLEFIPIEGDLAKPDSLQKFILENSTADFVSVRNPSIKYSDNKWNLYQNIDGIYHRIDVLGTTGFNEYNAINPNQKSSLSTQPIKTRSTNVGSEYYNKKTNEWIKIPLIDQVLPLDLGVEGILKAMYDSNLTSQEYKRTIERLQDFVNKDIKIEYAVPKSSSFGMYNSSTNTITISPDIYEQAINKTQGDFNKAINIVKEVILEEVIHSITVNELKEYIDRTLEDGTVILKDNSPIFATRLVAAFDIARTALPYNPKDITTYYSKDIFEFIAGMYVSPEYRDNIESRAPGLIQKFLDAIKRLFSHLSNKYQGEELTYKEEVYSTLEALLKTTTEVNTTQKKGIKVNPIEQMKQEDTTQDKPQVESSRIDIGKLSDYTEAPKETVTDLHGNTYEVYSDEITTYQTELGPVRYITDSNGDMVMLKEQQSTVNNNPSQYTNHSGGALGADTQWDIIGAEFGMVNNKHYYSGSKTPRGNVEITTEEFNEGRKMVMQANKTLNRRPEKYMNLLARNWAQVKYSDAIFAISSLVNEKSMIVNGGTGWAVQMAIDNNKPVYVFDQKLNKWFLLDKSLSQRPIELEDAPQLTQNFAGIGTREINEQGKQAIRNVYEKTFNTLNTNNNISQPNPTIPKISWARKADNSYEVSSKGDTRFSALNAKLKDGRTIEEAYQLDVKGYRAQGDNWRLGKGKAPLTSMTKEQTWQAYKNLWRQFLQENPDLEQDLREKASGKVLTDMFASTDVSQARALAEILNEENNQNNIIPVANIPQNLISGQEAFGTLQHATPEVRAVLGENPTSIDMVEAGLRTRTTRSAKEMQKYNIKVGDIVKQFGKSADGTTKNILTRVTAIHPKGSPEFFGTWEKEGWTADGVKAIERFKNGAAAIEFELLKSTSVAVLKEQQSTEDVLKNILDQQDNYLGLGPEDFNSRHNRYPEIKNCK